MTFPLAAPCGLPSSIEELARDAADTAAEAIMASIASRGGANVMLATGDSQLAFLAELATIPGIDWSRVVGFHMDEYVGMSDDHPASFARYMRERVVARVDPGEFHYLDGSAADPEAECLRYGELLAHHPLDLCCLGIGENGHLAFNDPPVADFADPQIVKVVELDDACKRQQVGEGHFPDVDAVPAIRDDRHDSDTPQRPCRSRRRSGGPEGRRGARRARRTGEHGVSRVDPATNRPRGPARGPRLGVAPRLRCTFVNLRRRRARAANPELTVLGFPGPAELRRRLPGSSSASWPWVWGSR